MKTSYQKIGLWVILALVIFSTFRWLMGIALPDAALAFALGITTILMAGLLSGRYLSRLWFKADHRRQNIVFFILSTLIILGCFAIGLLVNRMIEHTEFMHFFFTVITLFLVTAFAGAIISLIRNRIKTNILSAQSALVHTKSELQVLQSQLSPHFLFNTLNNLYGLSITTHEKVPSLLLRLSDLLRYSVYDAKEVFVPLKNELEYLKNYIEFEKIRLGERLNLHVKLEDLPDESIKIAPMLLIVFVENAFKHSKNNEDEKIYIDISLRLWEDSIGFSVKNSYVRSMANSGFDKKHSGFGLESVKKRLNLLYKDRHDLQIQESDKAYVVNLKLSKQ